MTPAASDVLVRVATDITRADIFRGGFLFSVRQWWMWLLCGIGLADGVRASLAAAPGTVSTAQVVSGLAFEAVLWTGVMLGVALVLGALTALSMSTDRGDLGRREVELRPDGLVERTAAGEALTRWSAVQTVVRTRGAHYVYLSWIQFHVVPARAFASAGEFEAFGRLLHERMAALAQRDHLL